MSLKYYKISDFVLKGQKKRLHIIQFQLSSRLCFFPDIFIFRDIILFIIPEYRITFSWYETHNNCFVKETRGFCVTACVHIHTKLCTYIYAYRMCAIKMSSDSEYY